MANLVWTRVDDERIRRFTEYDQYYTAYCKETGFKYAVKTEVDEDGFEFSVWDADGLIYNAEGGKERVQDFNNYILENYIWKNKPKEESIEPAERILTL